jgi:phosphatidylserine synthase
MTSPADAFDRRNSLTYLSLAFGTAALAAAAAGRAGVAGIAMAMAVIADTFDGRFARRFGNDPRRRALGVELDSLSDAIAFGIAPPLCSIWLLNADGGVRAALWMAAFVHAACAITRLASFNVDSHGDARGVGPGGGLAAPKPLAEGAGLAAPKPVSEARGAPKPEGEGGGPAAPKPEGEGGFVGIPVPVAALIWATALLVLPSAAATAMLIVITAAAMVMPLRIPRPTGAGLVLFTCWPVAVAILHALRL